MNGIKMFEEFVDNNDLKIKFNDLKTKWYDETKFVSDPNEIYNNQYYQKIISLGESVVPILMEDIDSQTGDWFHALKEITGVNPIKEGNGGYVPKMIEDWKNWYNINYDRFS